MSNYDSTEWAPVIIVGAPRSGTTLLASMLGNHPEIAIPPETHYFDITYARCRKSRVFLGGIVEKHSRLVECLFNNERIRDANLNKECVHRAFEVFPPDHKYLFRSFLQCFCDAHGKRLPAEKTPRHLEFVKTIIGWYPKAKVICIVRDGRDVAFSLMQAQWTHNNLERHAAYWGWCARRSASLRKRFPNNFLDIRFEDLVSFPVETLRLTCDFIGLHYDDSMLSQGKATSVVPEWEASWKTTSTASPDKTKLSQWKLKDQRTVMHIQKMIAKELREYKYPLLLGDELMDDTVGRMIKRCVWSKGVFSLWYFLSKLHRRIFPRVSYRERQIRTNTYPSPE